MQPADTGHSARAHWGLQEGMVFLNHGSYGAAPRILLEAQRGWQDRLERQPCLFINSELPGALRAAADRLAEFLGATPETLAFVENATAGIGAVLRSLALAPGDRIVITDHIYNAVRQTLHHVCDATGAELEVVALGLPVTGPDAVAERICAAITADVRLVCIDHIASASAVILPVDRIVAHCRALRVPVLVDGAHAPGMVALDLDALDADYYVGNCHKWLCAPKGAAFLRVADRARDGLHPLAISHAYGSGFPDEFHMIGTRDWSAALTVPEAIDFHLRMGGPALRARNHAIAVEGAHLLAGRLGTRPGAPDTMFGAMATVEMPAALHAPDPPERPAANALKARLWQDHRIEVHVMPLAGRLWLRFCIHAYNDISDVVVLADRLSDWRAAAQGVRP